MSLEIKILHDHYEKSLDKRFEQAIALYEDKTLISICPFSIDVEESYDELYAKIYQIDEINLRDKLPITEDSIDKKKLIEVLNNLTNGIYKSLKKSHESGEYKKFVFEKYDDQLFYTIGSDCPINSEELIVDCGNRYCPMALISAIRI